MRIGVRISAGERKIIIMENEIKLSSTYKGTRILFGDAAKEKRKLMNQLIDIAESYGYNEIFIPIIQLQKTFQSRVGEENQNLMLISKTEAKEKFV